MYPPHPTCPACSFIKVPRQSATLVTDDDPIFTHHNYPPEAHGICIAHPSLTSVLEIQSSSSLIYLVVPSHILKSYFSYFLNSLFSICIFSSRVSRFQKSNLLVPVSSFPMSPFLEDSLCPLLFPVLLRQSLAVYSWPFSDI